MREVVGNLWDCHTQGRWICITTNGFVKQDSHECVMGAGCAKEAKQRYPKLPAVLGRHIWEIGQGLTGEPTDAEDPTAYWQSVCRAGNHLYVWERRKMITYPVKWFWYETADIELIKRSAAELVTAMNLHDIEACYLPRPGCGNGKLSWERDVKPVLDPFFDDRVIVITNR